MMMMTIALHLQLQGSHSTKVAAIIQRVLNIQKDDSDAKILIFASVSTHKDTHTHTHFQAQANTHSHTHLRSSLLKIDVCKSQKHGCECCCVLSGSLCWQCHKRGWHVWNQYLLHHEPAFLWYSWVKSEPAWLHPKECKFEAGGYFCCINTDRTTIWHLAGGLAHLFCFVFRPASFVT